MKNILMLAAAFFILSGCQNDVDDITGFPSNNVILKGTLMVDTYNKVFSNTEGNIYFNNQNSDSGKSYALDAVFYKDADKKINVDVGKVKVNEIGMNYGGEVVAYDMSSGADVPTDIPALFGTEVAFYSQYRECAQSFYMPNEIELTYPDKPASDVRRFDRGDGMKIQWNADPLNPEGVFIYVRWDGRTYNDEQKMALVAGGINVESGAYVSDTGSYVLNNSILNGMEIPADALLSIQILRGHVGVVKGTKSMQCKAYGYSSFDFLAVAR